MTPTFITGILLECAIHPYLTNIPYTVCTWCCVYYFVHDRLLKTPSFTYFHPFHNLHPLLHNIPRSFRGYLGGAKLRLEAVGISSWNPVGYQ